MQLIAFSKPLKNFSIDQLVKAGNECHFDGFDMCVRKGFPITPENALTTLKETTGVLRSNALDIPLITVDTDLLLPSDARASLILKAMDNADVRLLKLGYFLFEPDQQDYWVEVDKARLAIAGWQDLGRKYDVKICCHVHSHCMLGVNCASLSHIIKDFDPEFIGAYIDPGHMVIEGEEFSTGAAMVKDYLCAVALKDVNLKRIEKNGHGSLNKEWIKAGAGMVDWTSVAKELNRVKFQGPYSIHMEFDFEERNALSSLKQETDFFRNALNYN